MYLKRLDIFGFKTFAEKTEILFTPGVTAVIGPNGSGKSNVGDAVLWVLGEQNIRALRGNTSQDVIFAGTDRRKPLGMAEVALTLDNSTGILPLEITRANLTRVNDIIAEIEDQLEPLRRQAQVARRHQELASHLRELELAWYATTLRRLAAEVERLGGLIADLNAERGNLEGQLE